MTRWWLRRPRSLTGRLVLWTGAAVLAVAVGLGVVLDRVLEEHLSPAGLAMVRWILVAGLASAVLAGAGAALAVGRGVAGSLRRMGAVSGPAAAGGRDRGVGDLEEVAALARTLDRRGREVDARIDAVTSERKAREAILSALREGVILFDRQGTVRYQNESARALVGPVTSVRSLGHVALQQAFARAARGEGPTEARVTWEPSSRVLEATATALPREDGVVIVLRDVTRALALDAVRRDFVANASHELKTPAASIRALAETIGSAVREDPDAVPRFADQLVRESARLNRVLSDLLDLSRLEGGTTERSPVRLDRLAEAEAQRISERAREAGVSLEVDPDGPVVVLGSSRDLALLVRNLVENAVQYTRPGGSVRVRVSAENGRARVVVSDTGMGIPARDRARVFERFYRVDRARSRHTGGTGLGLSIVKHVAENHGGSVEVDSEVGAGSTFTVTLPAP